MNVEKLRTLWDAHARAIHACLLQITRSQADASDLLQDVFCRLSRQPELLTGLPGEPRGFLLRLARNLAIDHVRRLQARDRVYEKARAGASDSVSAEDPDNPLLRQALEAALAHLPPEQREVVHDRLWKRRTLDEIAVARGISINTAASRYRYGLNKMREHLRPLYADLSNQPLSTPETAMKKNAQDPIIRSLDPRRVPSATGAFALPVLPAPDEVADLDVEHVELPADVEAEVEIIDVPDMGEEGDLPISFDDVAEGFEGEGEVPADGDLDVVWAYEEIFAEGEEGGGEVVDGGEGDDDEGVSDGDEGEGDTDGGVVRDGGMKGGTILTSNGTGSQTHVGGDVVTLGGGDTVAPQTSDTGDGAPVTEVDTTPVPRAPALDAQASPGSFVGTDATERLAGSAFEPVQSIAHTEMASAPAAFVSAPIVAHEGAFIEAQATALAFENDHDSEIAGHANDAGSIEAEAATVDQWVPLPVAADHVGSDGAAHVILTEPVAAAESLATEAAPDAGAVSQPSLNHGVLAMALTGAALAAHDPQSGERKPLRNILAVLVAFLSLLTGAMADDLGSTEQPSIAKIRGRAVTVAVPAGFDSVSLQKVRVIRRAAGRTEKVWATLDTQFPAGEARTLTFRLTKLIGRRNLRVIGSRSTPLPQNFLTGVTSFGGDSLGLSANPSTGGQLRTSDGIFTLSGNSTTANLDSAGSGGTPVSVVESDIWKIDGDRLYYFNQLRGLQVIDVTNPDDPGLLGTLRMPAAGEDLYVVDSNHVALLKRGNDWWGGPIRVFGGPVLRLDASASALAGAGTASPGTTLLPYSDAQRSNELIIADVSGGAPQQVASVPFKGALNESRLVGHVLYVATSTSRETADGGSEYGTEVIAFDLSDPANPARRDSVFIPGWSSMVTATPDYFVVTGGWPNRLQLVDISAGNGTLALAGSVSPEGYVADKFKIDIDGSVLTILSQVWLPWDWDENGELVSRGGLQTVLQTFSLADPSAPAPLGRLVIAPGESLRATRFDDGRVYVVTFEQIDPLHIVDLSDPANPTVSGEVEAPGFSTYIEPLGDRLVTIGLIDWKPAVSLFDVSDPAAPVLLQQLTLGGKNDGWSHSEAVWNEKAFKVLPQHNLILLPISGYDHVADDQWGGEWFSRVQLVDLKRDSLAARGVIDAGFSPRRADIIHANRIAAISPSKLVVVNAGNRDEPFVTAEVELAWSVDRVFHIGDYLVEIGGSADWTGAPAPTLTVAPANDPDASLTVVDLDPLDVVGSTLHNGTLYLAQRAWPRWWINDDAESRPQLLVTAYDMSALPALRKLSQASGPAPVDSWGQLTPLWPSPGTLVWAAEGHYLSLRPAVGDVIALAPNATRLASTGVSFRPWWGAWTRQFISFNVSAPENIAYGATVELKPSSASSFSAPFAQAGLVFISEQKLWDNSPADDVSDAGRHFLRVIEYTEPAAPFVREERVNIPGRLAGVARDGRLLYTVGCDLDATTGDAKGTAALHASAFDGTAAHLIATHPLASIQSPVEFAGPSVVILDEQPAYVWKPITIDPVVTDPAIGNTTGGVSLKFASSIWWGGSYGENPLHSSLRIAQLTDGGSFTELGSLELAHDFGLHLFGELAVTQPDWRSIRAIDLSNQLAPADLGAFSLPGNVWPNLDGADGTLGVGLWIPAGAYGVETLGLGD